MIQLGFLQKLRDEAHKSRWTASNTPTWKEAILETIFQPKPYEIPGKGPMDMLHPNIKKLHLPHGMYLADWRKYKVEDHPELVQFQKRCHAAGLHDPWLRNNAFRFYPNMRANRSIMAWICQGATTGIAVGFALWATVKYLFPPIEDKYSSHGSGHGHHDKHHE